MFMEGEITYKDVLEYQDLFMLVPSFIMERMAKRNSNLVLKFKPTIKSHMDSLNPNQKEKLDIILESDVGDLQDVLREAFIKTGKKQYGVLANPDYKEFIEKNLCEIKKLRWNIS